MSINESPVHIVTTGEQLAELRKLLLAEKVVGFDCEGEKLSRRGKICLFQTIRVELQDVFESKKVLKVMHDCRQDSDALYHLMQIRLDNVFDVQIGHQVLLQKSFEEHPSYKPTRPFQELGLPIGFAKLLRQYAGVQFDEKAVMHGEMADNDKLWSIRPLTEAMLKYASKDVQYLAILEQTLAEKLGPKYLEMAVRRSDARLDEFRMNERGDADYMEKFERMREALNSRVAAPESVTIIQSDAQLIAVVAPALQTPVQNCVVYGECVEMMNTAQTDKLTVLTVISLLIPGIETLFVIDLLSPALTPKVAGTVLAEFLVGTTTKISNNGPRFYMALRAQLGVKLYNFMDVSAGYNTFLRQRYEADPRYNAKRPFNDPGLAYSVPKLISSLCQVPYTDAYRQVAQEPHFWAQRPLSPVMIDYITKDTHYLIASKSKLEETLKDNYKTTWKATSKALCKKKPHSTAANIAETLSMQDTLRLYASKFYEDSIPDEPLVVSRKKVEESQTTPSTSMDVSATAAVTEPVEVAPVVQAEAKTEVESEEKSKKKRKKKQSSDKKAKAKVEE